jgi:hypothetical protein
MTWLIPPLVIGLVIDRRRWRTPAIAVIGILAITQAIFPWFYPALLALQPVIVLALTLRNLLLVALLVWMVVRIATVRSRVQRRASAAGQRTVQDDDPAHGRR